MRPSRALVPRLVVAAVLLASVAGAAAPAVAADDADAGTPLSVTITDGSTPTPTASTSTGSGGSTAGSGRPGTGSAVGGSSGGTTSGAGSSGGGTTQPETNPAGEVSVAGMLYVGGLNGSTAPSVNPGDGTVDLWFTVRNASKSVIDATAEFSLDGALFSNRLDTTSEVAITALHPGETRVVAASLHGAGQWTLLTGHVTLTPPESVDGTALAPVTRDGFFLLFPWLILSIVVVLAVAWAIVRVVRDALPPVPVAATT
ncbi:hypothetical protein [Microbacterium sp. RURRCA19A]|uniref:hypothetical protein n=1 Tax=Microbacterium sp. RURRCA19A TaxID=1907391 RepID=UPI000953E64C|nr:hypothetical protein [Microbacterium sp. RURRCA19A]SIS14946.1 hypothetical protein SAMN05880568_3106 [Microbacterium sp. RURRCA19A]